MYEIIFFIVAFLVIWFVCESLFDEKDLLDKSIQCVIPKEKYAKYKNLEKMILASYYDDFVKFAETGEASSDFLNYMKNDPLCQEAINLVLDKQAETFAHIGRIMRDELPIFELLKDANEKLTKELKDFPYQEEEPFICINKKWKIYTPFCIKNNIVCFDQLLPSGCRRDHVAISITDIYDVKFVEGHGI